MLSKLINKFKSIIKLGKHEDTHLDILDNVRKKYPNIRFEKDTNLFLKDIARLAKITEFIKKYDYQVEKYSIYTENKYIRLNWKQIETRDKRQDREHKVERFFVYQITIKEDKPFFYEKIKLVPDQHDTTKWALKKIKKWFGKPLLTIWAFFLTVYIVSLNTWDWSWIKDGWKDMLIYLEDKIWDIFVIEGIKFYLAMILGVFLLLLMIYILLIWTYKWIYKPIKNFFLDNRVMINNTEFEERWDIICENSWYAKSLFNEIMAEKMIEIHKLWIEYVTLYRHKIYLKLILDNKTKWKNIEKKLENLKKEIENKAYVAHNIWEIINNDFLDNLKGKL